MDLEKEKVRTALTWFGDLRSKEAHGLDVDPHDP